MLPGRFLFDVCPISPFIYIYFFFLVVVKIETFQQKLLYIFLIFAQNVDCWYTLEPHRRAHTIYVL